MTPGRTLTERQKRLKQALTRHQVTVSADSADWAEIQAALARGDRRLAPALLEVDQLSPRGFREALARHGLSMEELLAARDPNAFMPWEIVDAGLRPGFLRRENRLALEEITGHRCPPQGPETGGSHFSASPARGLAVASGDSLDGPLAASEPCLACGVCDLSYWLDGGARGVVRPASRTGGTINPQSEFENPQSDASK
jgi:hypothetical protein